MGKKKKISPKLKAAAHEYIKDWNIYRAMVTAGYSHNYAKAQGYRMLENVGFVEYVEKIKNDIATEAGISKLSLISELKKIAFSDITNIQQDWITRKDFDELPNDVKACIQEISSSIKKTQGKKGKEIETEYVKIKFHDKTKAIQDIMKAMGWNEPSKLEIKAETKIKQIFKIGDQEITF